MWICKNDKTPVSKVAAGGDGRPPPPPRVLVTGAGGKTGRIVLRKLLERGNAHFEARATVRTEASAAELTEYLGRERGTVDVRQLDITTARLDQMYQMVEGCDAMIICTSAVPKLVYMSLLPLVLRRCLGYPSGKPEFFYEEGASPEEVDWLGQKLQIDAARVAGVKHVVLLGSMAGSQPEHFLNQMGNGNILLWKRKAEKYLIDSGLNYTIVHAGGLLPHAGPSASPAAGGRRELVVGVNDTLLDSATRTIPREDVAEVLVQALLCPAAARRSFDLAAHPEHVGTRFKTLTTLLASIPGQNCDYSYPDLPLTTLVDADAASSASERA